MKKFRLFISIILIISLIGIANAATYNRVLNGDFDGNLNDWSQYTFGTAAVSYDVGTGGAQLYTDSGSAVARIYQTINLTNVSTLSVTYQTDADWHTTATFKVTLDGTGTVLYSNSGATGGTTQDLDVSGYSGDHSVWIYVINDVGGSNIPDTAYVTKVEVLAPIIPISGLITYHSVDTGPRSAGIGYYAPNAIVNISSTWSESDPPMTVYLPIVTNGVEGTDWDYINSDGALTGRRIQFYNVGDYNIQDNTYAYYDGHIKTSGYNLTNSFINISGTVYDWTLDFYDTSGNPITTTLDLVLYTDTVLNTTSTTTGTIKYYDLLSGSYACEISSGGSYITETEYVVLAADTETNVTLTAYSNYQNIFPSPNVKCNFRGSYGQALVNYTIYSTYSNSSGSESWFSSLFGYSDSSFIATPLTQATDAGGNVVMPWVPTATYTVYIYNPAGTLIETIAFNPVQNGEYSFRIDTLDYVVWNGTANPYINVVNSSVFLIGVNYNDTSLSTTTIEFFVNVNGSQEYKETLGGIQAYNFSTEINNTKGVRYTWGIIAQTGVYGNITVADSITARGGEKLVDLGIDADYPDIYVWVSVFILIVFGAIFSQTTAEYGAIALCFLGGGLYYIDWFDGEVRILRVGIAMTVAIVYFVKTKYRRD